MSTPSKYAQVERERKFVLRPDLNLIEGLRCKSIADLYFTGTHVRLRKMADGLGSVYKLTKKTSMDIPGESSITTIYLTKAEYEFFAMRPGVAVEKTRHLKPYGRLTIGIDVYTKKSDTVWLAEVEFLTAEEMRSFDMPIPFAKDVTDDPQYSGYQLAKKFSTR